MHTSCALDTWSLKWRFDWVLAAKLHIKRILCSVCACTSFSANVHRFWMLISFGVWRSIRFSTKLNMCHGVNKFTNKTLMLLKQCSAVFLFFLSVWNLPIPFKHVQRARKSAVIWHSNYSHIGPNRRFDCAWNLDSDSKSMLSVSFVHNLFIFQQRTTITTTNIQSTSKTPTVKIARQIILYDSIFIYAQMDVAMLMLMNNRKWFECA